MKADFTVLACINSYFLQLEDAKIIRDRRGVSKGYGFIDMRSDKEGENQTQELLKRRTMYYGDQTIVFKPAYRKSPSSQVSLYFSFYFQLLFYHWAPESELFTNFNLKI